MAKHGGARPGGGRPGQGLVHRLEVRLSAEQLEALDRLRHGYELEGHDGQPRPLARAELLRLLLDQAAAGELGPSPGDLLAEQLAARGAEAAEQIEALAEQLQRVAAELR